MKKYCYYIKQIAFMLYSILSFPGMLLSLLVVAIFADLPSYIVRKTKHFLGILFFPCAEKEQ